MKSIILTLVISIFINLAYSQDKHSYYQNGEIKTTETYGTNNQLTQLKRNYSSGNVMVISKYENDKKVESKYFYTTGELQRLEFYEHDQKNGQSKKFYRDGTVMEIGEYKNNDKTGEWKWYYRKSF